MSRVLFNMIKGLNPKLEYSVSDGIVTVTHSDYGVLCLIGTDDDPDLAEEIIRDSLFDASESF